MTNSDAYLIHKVDKLWKEVEEIKKKLEDIEARIESLKVNQAKVPNISPSPTLSPSIPARNQNLASEASVSDPVIRILREKGPLNIIQLNSALRELGIAETIRDTLFNRVKKLMKEGKVEFNEKDQTFYVR